MGIRKAAVPSLWEQVAEDIESVKVKEIYNHIAYLFTAAYIHNRV